ncbi:calcium-binding protein LPS1-beta-like isoform X2 [Lytechinus variegatus]|uniref:calcium-binding protein LPS1-beta-like isoform X2 n=1 Tax=Lytechinus variegatus TaxID=7654 RepID=UPI001BB1EA50|nr:calcium-binding protein LPS1-beta-like isoform X2 [Lytechinus variegatus]
MSDALAKFTRGVPKSVIEEMKKEFKDNYDTNNDGTVSCAELAKLMDCPEEEAQKMIATVDVNCDGRMQFDELVLFMEGSTKADLYSSEEIQKMFEDLDKDGNGKISPEELSKGVREIYTKLIEGMATKLIQEADKDDDGHVNMEEFCDTLVEKLPVRKDRFLNEQLLECIKKDFKEKFDKNGDGSLTNAEMSELMNNRYSSYSDEEIKEMISRVDLNDDGRMQFSEFLLYVQNMSKDDIKNQFKAIDKDENGKISPEEMVSGIKEIYASMVDSEVAKLIKEADFDGDGCVDIWGEFIKK